MSNRFSSEDQRQTLKTMWRLLLRRTGLGLEEIAADITRLSKPCLSKAGSTHDDYFAPVDAVLDLELAAGDPLVTRALARAQGFRLVPMDATAQGLDMMRASTESTALLGDLSRDVLAAINDGRVTVVEREKLIGDLRVLMKHLNQWHDSLALGDSKVADIRKARGEGHAG